MPLFSAPIRALLEKAVSQYRGRDWRVKSAQDLSEFACHPCGIFSDGSAAVFVKFSRASDAAHQFEIELAGLEYLSQHAGIPVPAPIGIVPAADGTLLVMQALNVVERGPHEWKRIGKTLAQIHRIRSDRCGFHMDNYFGPLEQDNTPAADWATFYGERRLRPRLKSAVDSGNLPSSVASQVERIIRRLPNLCGPEQTPALLHGDAQQNNFLSTAEGTFTIDPAVHYGNPELDLAFVDYFQPVPEDVIDGYREELPIDAGFSERRDLWRISGYLAAVAVEGQAHLSRLTNALRRYA
jgi:protein-ribulosamine 3-kinase